MKQELIDIYQKGYKKIYLLNICAVIMYLICVGYPFYYLLSQNMYGASAFFFVLIFIGAVMLNLYFQVCYTKELRRLFQVLIHDLDLRRVRELYEEVLSLGKRRNYRYVIVQYLNILLINGDFESFERVYIENRKLIQKSLGNSMSMFRESLAFLQDDSQVYQDIYETHKFSKYRYVKTDLPERKASMRFGDEAFEIAYLYYTHRDEDALSKIENAHPVSPYDQLLMKCYKAATLYHLGQKEDYSWTEQYADFLCVQKLQYLLKHGEELTVSQTKHMIEWIQTDCHISQKKMKKRLAAFLIFVVVELAVIGGLAIYHSSLAYHGFIRALEDVDYVVEETYNVYEDKNMATGIFYGREEGIAFYYLASVKIEDGYVTNIRTQSIGWMLDDQEIYTIETDGKCYVCVVVDENQKIYYDGQIQDMMENEIPVFGGSTQTIASCVIEGNFDASLLEIK